MNKEIKNKEIRDEALENVNGGTGFGILPGFDITMREQKNREIGKSSMELNDDALAGVSGGRCLTAILNPFDEDMNIPSRGADDTHNANGED